MGWFNDIVDTHFTADQNRFDKIRDDPLRSILPSATPLEAGVTNKIFGTEYSPIISQMGGETPDDWKRAESKGIDTRNARTLSTVGDVIAGIIGGSYGADALGWTAGFGGEAGGAAAGAEGGAEAGAGAAAGEGFSAPYGGGEEYGAMGTGEAVNYGGGGSGGELVVDPNTGFDIFAETGGLDTPVTSQPGGGDLDAALGQEIAQGWEGNAAQAQSAPASAQPAPATPTSSSWMSQAKKYGVPLALLGVSTALSGKKSEIPNKAQYQELSAEAQALAKQLIEQYRSGTLSPAQQAQLDQLTAGVKNQINQQFAANGQAGSTAHRQALAKADNDALAVKANMLQSSLQQGLQAIGVAQGPLNTMANYQMQNDKRLQDAYANFARSAAYLYGSSQRA